MLRGSSHLVPKFAKSKACLQKMIPSHFNEPLKEISLESMVSSPKIVPITKENLTKVSRKASIECLEGSLECGKFLEADYKDNSFMLDDLNYDDPFKESSIKYLEDHSVDFSVEADVDRMSPLNELC
eukprot:TRINITY_DN476_c0_g1_i2.p1 TRINITY_DN476_c0_g1~~TRINITY_DN476_c0_g1_i2.p1  ORF type:complete len:127 (-),score=16.27 TRINITY_DN476_c0_g1_i2:128-508(-)